MIESISVITTTPDARKTTAVLCQTASAVHLETATGCQHFSRRQNLNNANIVLKPPLTNNTMPTWMHVSLVKYYRLLPGHHCESASLSPALSLSLFLSLLSSPLSAKAGSKNSGELNSHNNMRLSGDRRSTVCAGQYRGSNSSEPGLLTATKHCDKRVTVGICLCVVP